VHTLETMTGPSVPALRRAERKMRISEEKWAKAMR
jgi:hypothetical protein